jgi:hypothetical protein
VQIKLRKFLLEPLFVISLILVSSFMIWPPAVQSISIVILFITLLFRIKKLDYNSINFLVSLFFIFLYILSYFWSTDKKQYLDDFQHIIGFFIALLFFYDKNVITLNLKHKQIIYITICISLVYYFICWSSYLINGFEYYYEYNNIKNDYKNNFLIQKIIHILKFRLYENVTITRVLQDAYVPKGQINFFYHHSYLGAFLVILCYYSLFKINKICFKINNCIYLFFSLFCFIWLFFIESKINKLAFIININVLLFSFLYKKLNKKYFTILAIVVSVLCIKIIFFTIQTEYIVEMEPHSLEESLKYYVDYTRYELFKAIYFTISQNFFFGVGIGDVIKEVNSKLPTVSYTASVGMSSNSKYNTHSMFLYVFCGLGFFGFISFCYYFIVNFFKSFIVFDYYKLTFFTILILNISFENFFLRIWGIAFFIIFIIFNYINNENKIR